MHSSILKAFWLQLFAHPHAPKAQEHFQVRTGSHRESMYPNVLLWHNIRQDFVVLVVERVGGVGQVHLVLIVQQYISLPLVVKHV